MDRQLSTEQRLINMIEGIRAGAWEWNVQSGETLFNDRRTEIIFFSD